jgi:NADPH:quinone reductase-like Zn-dependent oxidoreductase
LHAASVNPIDYNFASGALHEYILLGFPWIPGVDFSGVVEDVGPETSSTKLHA